MNNSMRNEVQARWRGLRIFVIMATLLLSVFLSASGAFAAGNEILVDISSATTDLQRGAALRAAITTATNGDTVVIPAGIYDVAAGGAGINVGAKAINLRGAGSGQTILDGSHITSSTTANAAVFKQRIDYTTITITFTGITFRNGGTSKSSGIDFICYHDATPGVSSTLILNDIAVTGNKNAGVNINSARVIANGLQSSGNGLAGVSIGDPHGSASFTGNDYVFTETYSGANTINKKVGVYVDKAQTSYTVNASYKDVIKVAQATFASSATATETPIDNFVITGSGFVSRFYFGLPDPTSIALPQGLKTLTEDGDAVPMTENQFSFSVNESVSGGAVSTNTIFSPTMDANGLITLGTGNIPISSAGTYTYTVRETGMPSPGYTQDTNDFEVSYIVSKGATALTASSPTIMKYDSNGNLLTGTAIQFENTYSSSGSGAVAVTKQLTGKTLTADMFSFTIVQTDGAWNAIANGYTETAGNNADGSIPFSSINLTKAGTYYYTLTENKGSLPGITYDDRVIKVTMTATDNGQGNLTVTTSYDGGQVFSNRYAAIPTATVQPTGSPIPQPPKTGDVNNIATWLIVCALSIVGLVTLMVTPCIALNRKMHGSVNE